MKKFIQFSLALLLYVPSIALPNSNQSVISKMYCSFLGDKDPCFACKEQVYQALKDLGVEEPSCVSVKQMNGVGPVFALIPVSSFTAFGIWLDEAYLHTCSEEERTFHIYHEAAHYALNHHQKVLAGCGIALLLVTVGFTKLKSAVSSNAVLMGMGTITALGCYRYLLPYLVKRQEKQADLLAADTLIALGKQPVVVAHIEDLRKLDGSDEGDLWWYSNKEQAEYLEAALIHQQKTV